MHSIWTRSDLDAGVQHRGDSRPQLDWDVLHNLCDTLTDTSDILSFSSTCSALRTKAIQRFLSVRPIVLKDERSTRSIHNIIFADKAQRAPHVRALEIRAWAVDAMSPESRPIVADYLFAILTCADNLKSLDIPELEMVDNFFSELDPKLLPALRRFTTLRQLSICGSEGLGDQAAELIQSIRSPLKVLRADLFTEDTTCTLDRLAAVTAPFASTLQAVELDGIALEADTGFPHIPLHPSLRSLKARFLTGLPLLADVLSVFPGLKALSFNNVSGDPTGSIPIPKDLIPWRVREENKEAQEARSWTHFDKLACDAVVCFSLALKCPIRHLAIHDCCTQNKTAVTVSLRENPPSQLTLNMSLSPDDLSVFDGLFPTELAATLTHLCLVLSYHMETGTRRSDVFGCEGRLNALVPSIAHLRPRFIRLIFQTILYSERSYLPVSKEAMRAASELPYQHILSTLASSIPSLEYVFLTAAGSATDYGLLGIEEEHQWQTGRALKISRVGDQHVEELSEEVAAVMLAKEDLLYVNDDPAYRYSDSLGLGS